jgi:SAM-dependent methyltransferase
MHEQAPVALLVQRRSNSGLSGWLSYAYGVNRYRDRLTGETFDGDYDQRHTVNAYVSRRLRPTVNVSARFTYGSGMPFPGFYRQDGTAYFLTTNRNGLRAPAYERTDLRLNKAYVHKKSKATLFAEVHRVLRPGGRLLLVYPAEPVRGLFAVGAALALFGNPLRARELHLHKLTPRRLQRTVAAGGLPLTHVVSELQMLLTPQFVTLFAKH